MAVKGKKITEWTHRIYCDFSPTGNAKQDLRNSFSEGAAIRSWKDLKKIYHDRDGRRLWVEERATGRIVIDTEPQIKPYLFYAIDLNEKYASMIYTFFKTDDVCRDLSKISEVFDDGWKVDAISAYSPDDAYDDTIEDVIELFQEISGVEE